MALTPQGIDPARLNRVGQALARQREKEKRLTPAPVLTPEDLAALPTPPGLVIYQ